MRESFEEEEWKVSDKFAITMAEDIRVSLETIYLMVKVACSSETNKSKMGCGKRERFSHSFDYYLMYCHFQ